MTIVALENPESQWDRVNAAFSLIQSVPYHGSGTGVPDLSDVAIDVLPPMIHRRIALSTLR